MPTVCLQLASAGHAPRAEKDRPIFQAAVARDANHLLTGDSKDFGLFINQLEESSGVLVQTVAEFLRSLLQ